MQWNNALDEIIGSKLKIQLLRYISGTTKSCTGRELAKAVGFSHTHTNEALAELEYSGILIKQRAGASYLYSINPKSRIFSEILAPAFNKEKQLVDDLAAKYYDGLGTNLKSILIFGSVARKEDHAESDIDLILIMADRCNIEKVEEKTSEISVDAILEFGGYVSAFPVKESEYRNKIKRGKGMWRDIRIAAIPIPRPLRKVS